MYTCMTGIILIKCINASHVLLTYADVCGRMWTYVDVCWRVLTYDVYWHMMMPSIIRTNCIPITRGSEGKDSSRRGLFVRLWWYVRVRYVWRNCNSNDLKCLSWARSHWTRHRQSHINSDTSREQSGSQILTVISLFSMPLLSARTQATKKTLLLRGHLFWRSGTNEATRIRNSTGSRCDAPHVILNGFQGSSYARRPRAVYQTQTKHLVLRGACVGAFAPLWATWGNCIRPTSCTSVISARGCWSVASPPTICGEYDSTGRCCQDKRWLPLDNRQHLQW